MILFDKIATFLIQIFWSIVLPQLTWLFTYFLVILPENYRFPVIALWILLIFWSKNEGFSFGETVLSAIAKAKNLHVRRKGIPAKKIKSALYGLHPHGRFPLDIYPYFASDVDLHSVKIASASEGKYFPTIACGMSLYGKTLDANKSVLIKELERNSHIAIFPGGAKEMHECNTYGNEIFIVQHNGFLRLARATNSQVVPCFLFGMNESYFSPFQKFQRSLYKNTKVSLPIWFPAALFPQKGEGGMVVGSSIETSVFKSDDELIEHYWQQLQNLFDEYKGYYKGYQTKTLNMVSHDLNVTMKLGFDHRSTISGMKSYTEAKYDPSTGPKSLSPSLLMILRFASFLNIVFITFTLSFSFILKKQWWMSSQGIIWESVPAALPVHIVSSVIWTVTSTLNFFKLQTRREHMIFGYIASFSLVGIISSGVLMQLESYVNSIGTSDVINWKWSGNDLKDKRLNAIIQAMSIFQVGFMSLYLLISAIRAARQKRIQQHKEKMSQIHLLLTDMFTPRISAFILRFAFPMIGRECIVTLASIIQWYRHMVVLRTKSKHLIPHNIVSLLLSITLLICYESRSVLLCTPVIMVAIALTENPNICSTTMNRCNRLKMSKRLSMVRNFKACRRPAQRLKAKET